MIYYKLTQWLNQYDLKMNGNGLLQKYDNIPSTILISVLKSSPQLESKYIELIN